MEKQYQAAFFLCFIAGLSDGLDGILARRYNWISKLGSFLDPLADKLFVIGSFFALAYIEKVPCWLFIIVFVRDIVIMSGVGGLYLFEGRVEFKPSMISKLNTVLQLATIFFLLFELAYAILPAIFIQVLITMMLVTTVLSLLNYTWVWGRHAYRIYQS